jgi:pantoate--beta-alanine ligase
MPTPRVLEDPTDLASFRRCAFVPTMGALHEGHASLLRRAKATARPVVLSIFVNPTQFGPNEDFSRYPRTFDADRAIAEREGVDAILVPSVETLYPEGLDAARAAAERLALPEVATRPGLEDRCRPGHFAGVRLVVERLFDLVDPAIAVFGEKDWQQLRLVESFVAEGRARWPGDGAGLAILRAPTVREPDGLAMSSRNRYLDEAAREQARGVPRAFQIAHTAQRPATAERLLRETLEEHGFSVDYAVVRDAETLLPVEGFESPTRALVAVRTTPSGDRPAVRLIDNVPMTIWR